MRQDAVELARSVQDPTSALNLLREYIQACILQSLHASRGFESLSFVGGTALRFLYNLPRFSEDLDFSLESSRQYAPNEWLAKLRSDLEFQGYEVSLSLNEKKIVHAAWVRIAGILYQTGLSPRREQNLSIKLEIDTRPPAGAVLEKRMLTRHILFGIRHHDLSSLMAGKIRAMLTRPYPKGRDWFDLLWYGSRVPAVEPNITLLVNALSQGGPVLVNPNSQDSAAAAEQCARRWKHALSATLESLDFEALKADVAPFLEHREDAAAMRAENLRAILDR